jgi:hypothetical protein
MWADAAQPPEEGGCKKYAEWGYVSVGSTSWLPSTIFIARGGYRPLRGRDERLPVSQIP